MHQRYLQELRCRAEQIRWISRDKLGQWYNGTNLIVQVSPLALYLSHEIPFRFSMHV